MDMQDKELDKLFQSSLDGLEIEPSAQVWSEIAVKLDAAKRKGSILPYLSIAAGILLLLTAGLLFTPKMVKVSHTDPIKIAKSEMPVKSIGGVKILPPAVVAYQQNKKAVKAVIAPVSGVTARKTKGGDKEAVYSIGKQDIVTERSTDEPELALAIRPDKPAAEPDSKVELTAPVNNLLAHVNNLQQISAQSPRPKSRPVKKHRIRSLGDVFNVVIAAVDKREDKIIEFSNTDEDDATITGLNLGIIKVKKEK